MCHVECGFPLPSVPDKEPKHIKALIRRGQALKMTHDFERSRCDYQLALDTLLASSLVDVDVSARAEQILAVRTELAVLAPHLARQVKQERARYAGMFDKAYGGATAAPSGSAAAAATTGGMLWSGLWRWLSDRCRRVKQE